MPFPVIPLLIGAGIFLVAKSKRDKSKEKGQTLITELAELPDEVVLEVGDVLTVELPHASGTAYEWTIFTEAVEGNPTLIVSEEVEEPQEDMPGAPYVHRFVLEAAEPGAVKVDFADQNQIDETEPPQVTGTTIVRIV